jgi:2-hydroxymethylglutarate dehydrogenase
MQVGLIGIGAMGGPMAVNLCKAGFELTVYDVNKVAVRRLTEQGAVAAATPKELAMVSEAVITMLPNFQIVSSIMEGTDGVLAGVRDGAIIVDMSTVAPHQTRAMAAKAAERGAVYLDAPVSGGVSGAEKGTLTIMVGGPDEAVDRVMQIFEALGKKVYRVGDVGSGDAVKLANNLLLGVNMAAVAEALVIGVKAGLNPRVLLEVIRSSSGASYALEAKADAFILNGKFEPGFAIDLQYKDLELATQTGKDMGVPLFMTGLAQQLFEQARAAGLGDQDISAVIRPLEKLVGIEVRG